MIFKINTIIKVGQKMGAIDDSEMRSEGIVFLFWGGKSSDFRKDMC